MMLIFRFFFLLLLASFASEASAKVQMQIYVSASASVIQYIDKLFVSRDLGVDWWSLDCIQIVQCNLIS